MAGAVVEVGADELVDVSEQQLAAMMEKIAILSMAVTRSENAQEVVGHGVEDGAEVVEDHLGIWVCFSKFFYFLCLYKGNA